MNRAEALNLFQGIDAMMGNQKPRTAARKIINLIYDHFENEETDYIDVETEAVKITERWSDDECSTEVTK